MWEDHFPCWGVSQRKQKVSRFGLNAQGPSSCTIIFSNYLKPTSQLVKREAISLLTFALHTLCIRSPCLCWWHSRQLSIFRVKLQAAELSVNNFKLSSLSSHLGSLSPSCALLPGSAWAYPRGFRLLGNPYEVFYDIDRLLRATMRNVLEFVCEELWKF